LSESILLLDFDDDLIPDLSLLKQNTAGIFGVRMAHFKVIPERSSARRSQLRIALFLAFLTCCIVAGSHSFYMPILQIYWGVYARVKPMVSDAYASIPASGFSNGEHLPSGQPCCSYRFSLDTTTAYFCPLPGLFQHTQIQLLKYLEVLFHRSQPKTMIPLI